MRYDFRFLFNILVIGTIIRYRKFILPILLLLLLIGIEAYFWSVANENDTMIGVEVLSYIMFLLVFSAKVADMVWLIKVYKKHKEVFRGNC
jgi:hypothetical protein